MGGDSWYGCRRECRLARDQAACNAPRDDDDAVRSRGSAGCDFFFSCRRRHTSWPRDWSSDVCSSDLGAGHLVEMATGTNAQIIAYSQYFRTSLYFLMILIGLVIVNLFIFVPIWGLTGAAFAISLAILLNNLMRFSFVKYKFDMQPFTRKSGIVLLIFFLALGINYLIPSMALIPDLIKIGRAH